MNKLNLLLLLLAVVIAISPLLILKDVEFEGADDEAEDLIGEISPDYEPWFDFFWEPPSGEVESLLFSLQVGLGAGTIGYIFGTVRERRKFVNNR